MAQGGGMTEAVDSRKSRTLARSSLPEFERGTQVRRVGEFLVLLVGPGLEAVFPGAHVRGQRCELRAAPTSRSESRYRR